MKKQRGLEKSIYLNQKKKMIDLSYENVSEFKKPEITRLIKKSISVGIKEMHFEKTFIFQFFTNINMKKLILNRRKNKTTNVLSFSNEQTIGILFNGSW